MILVTGSAGKTGRAVLQALLARGETVRALVYRPEQIPAMEALGLQHVLAGDMRQPADMERAFDGVRRVYHICPNVNPDERAIGEVVLAAAMAAGVDRFVFHSVLHPQTEAMPHHWQKLRVEERLLACGLPYTVLQPAVYMQNILVHWETILSQGTYPVPYPPETRLSWIDLQDLGEAAAIVLTEPGHGDATYQLVGTLPLSQHDVAAILSRRLGRPVRVAVVPLEEWERQARHAGLGVYEVDALTRMFRYYARFGLSGNPKVLSWLLGRSPATLEDFIEAHAGKQ
jgi:uncharacterized protein YbjT (DUF2867 family)